MDKKLELKILCSKVMSKCMRFQDRRKALKIAVEICYEYLRENKR